MEHGQTKRDTISSSWLKEIQSLAVESIKKMQVICKSLRLARYEQETIPIKKGDGQCATKERNLALYEQEKLAKYNDRQCKLEDKRTMGAPQNQIIPPSHYSSMQHGKIELLCKNHFQIKPLRIMADFKGGGILHVFI